MSTVNKPQTFSVFRKENIQWLPGQKKGGAFLFSRARHCGQRLIEVTISKINANNTMIEYRGMGPMMSRKVAKDYGTEAPLVEWSQ